LEEHENILRSKATKILIIGILKQSVRHTHVEKCLDEKWKLELAVDAVAKRFWI